MNNELKTVKPCNPIAPYLGGKRGLAKTITPLLDKIPHKLYAEPFVGMGGVFFRRTSKPKAEVINDISYDISNLFRIIERFPVYFQHMLEFKVCSRLEFQRLLETPASLLTDFERAVRFLYLQKNAFGGKSVGQSFGVATERPARFNALKVVDEIEKLHHRLSDVVIENLPYQELIRRYDREYALFYLDPPYWGCENDYGKNIFERADFENLAKLLGEIKGKFVMSINDVPEIREIFKKFHIMDVTTTYSICTNNLKQGKEAKELLISNVDLKGL
ncbi:MAG: DNA adenine methylase [Alphaproteobacteria bacterium]